MLHVQGIGQHRFQFTYRLPWNRTGGWRELQGTLPAQGGARFQINPPNEAADLRLKGFVDRDAFETTAGEGSIASALAPAGTFNVAWRPKVLEGITDRGLAVKANAVFDVRQDVLRLTTQFEFLFPRGRRERFTLQVPMEYPVERVTGPNVRGWQATEAGGNRQIEVTLLKETTEREEITVTVARYGAVGQGEMELFRVPLIQVPGAELQQGTVVLRRDDRLDVRVNAAEALSREDAELAPQLAQAADAYDVSLLPVRVFQAYRYVSLPVLLRLAAEPHTDATKPKLA